MILSGLTPYNTVLCSEPESQSVRAISGVERAQLDAGGKVREKLKSLFGVVDVSEDNDVLYVVADMAAAAIQYGYQNEFCEALSAVKTEDQLVNAYAKIGKKVFSDLDMKPFDDSYEAALSLDPKDYLNGFGSRAWYYQTCTEYGYFQVAYHDPSLSARSSRIDLSYNAYTCRRLFGKNTSLNTKSINHRFYLPLFDPTTSKIFISNGANDPWNNLSILPGADAEKNPELTVVLMKNAAHCDDLAQTTNSFVQKAQEQAIKLITQWVE